MIKEEFMKKALSLAKKAALAGEVPVNLESEIPVWARENVYLLCSAGIFDMDFNEITKDRYFTKEECAVCLYKLMKM